MDGALPTHESTAKREIPSLQSWLSVLSIAAGTFLLVTTEFLPIGLLTRMAGGLGISEGEAGLAVTVPGAVAALAAPALMIVAGRLDRRGVLWLLTALIIASNALAAIAPNLAVLLAGRVLLGIGVGGLWTFAVAAGRRLVSEPSGGRATAIISAGIAIGTVVGVPAGAAIGEWLGWRTAFATTAVFGLIVLGAQLILLPSLPTKQPIGARQLLALFQVPQARVGLIAVLLIAGGQFAAYTYLEPFLRQVPRMDQSILTPLLVAYGMAGIAGTFVGEIAAARGVHGAFVGATVLLGASVLLAAMVGESTAAAFILVTLWGFAFGAVPVCIQIWMYQAAPEAYEGGSALFVAVFQIALAAGAFSGGLIVDATGVTGAFILGGMLALATSALLGLFGRDRRTASALT